MGTDNGGKRRTKRYLGGDAIRFRNIREAAKSNSTLSAAERHLAKWKDTFSEGERRLLEGDPDMIAAATGRPAIKAEEPDGLGDIAKGIDNFRSIVGGTNNLMDVIRGIVEANQQGEPTEAEGGGGLPGYTALAMPSRDSYLAPFLQAEQAANEAHTASTGVINQGAEQLVNRLSQGQEQFIADRDELGREEAMRRRLAQQELDQTLAPSGLAQELGVAPGIQAEGALIQGLANMANQSQDSLNENMAESQAQGFQSRLESADASKTNALATAANTLQALLAQIGIGKAEAEQAYTQDANRVRSTNQQNEASARREFQKLQEEQRQAEEKLVQERQAIIDEYSQPAWDATRPLRAIKNPNALAFFEGLIDNVAGKARSPQAKRAILEVLPEQIQIAREAGDGNFNEKVLREWVEEYFSDKKILDEEALMRDPRARGLG